MKALFVHDHIFYKKEENYFSPGGLPKEAWSRYLDNVDELIVVSRGSNDENKSGLILSSREKIQFDLFYQVKGGLDYYKFKKDIVLKLKKYIQEVDFVIIRVPSTIGFFAYEICKKLNKPFVTEVVGCAWDSSWNYGSLPIKLQAPLGFMRMKKMVKNSFATTYVTKYFLQKRYPTNSNIVIHASNVQIPPTEDSLLERHLNLLNREDNKIYNIGIIGNLSVKYKGFDVALKALKLLKENYPNFKFHLVGGGDQTYVKDLIKENQLEDNCIIVGRLQAGEDIFNFLDQLDLYIHPSKQEGLPRSVIEAMSRACPVLGSSVAGIPELIEAKYLHKPGDVNKLYQDLSNLFSNDSELIEMSKNNYIKSKEYTVDILERRRSEFYKNIVEKISK